MSFGFIFLWYVIYLLIQALEYRNNLTVKEKRRKSGETRMFGAEYEPPSLTLSEESFTCTF
jgi:hypothetical protein